MDNSRVVVLRGTVSHFSKERATGDFLLSDADRSTAGRALMFCGRLKNFRAYPNFCV